MSGRCLEVVLPAATACGRRGSAPGDRWRRHVRRGRSQRRGPLRRYAVPLSAYLSSYRRGTLVDVDYALLSAARAAGRLYKRRCRRPRRPPTTEPDPPAAGSRWHAVVGIDAATGRGPARGAALARSSVPKSQPQQAGRASPRVGRFARRSARLVAQCGLIVAFGQPPARAKRTPAACPWPKPHFYLQTARMPRVGSGRLKAPLVRLTTLALSICSRIGALCVAGCKMGRYGDRDRRDDRRDHRSSGGGERRHEDRRRSRSRSRGRRRGRSRSRSRSYDRRRRRDHGATTCLAH